MRRYSSSSTNQCFGPPASDNGVEMIVVLQWDM